MSIEVYGLDSGFSLCARRMGAKVYGHDFVIDAHFPEDVEMSTYRGFIKLNNMDGEMVVGPDEFFTITIS